MDEARLRMEDPKRTMSNQLERFQGSSETRWPSPSGVFCSSGADRKALSRYINEYIAESEKNDSQIRMNRSMTTSEPPLDWDPRFITTQDVDESAESAAGDGDVAEMSTDQGPDSARIGEDLDRSEERPPQPPLSPSLAAMAAVHDKPASGMTRFEYIKRQNASFKESTGQRSWSDISAKQAHEDSKDAALVNSLELYMAALDEKIYMSADHMRAMIGIRDKEVRDRYEESKEYGATAFDLVESRDMYQSSWFEHSDLAHQRDQLEIEMAQLRYDHALQEAKVVRSNYATHVLGRKLVDAQAWKRENAELHAEMDALRRENQNLAAQNEASRTANAGQAKAIDEKWSPMSDEHKGREVETKIAKLFELAVQLKVCDDYMAQNMDLRSSGDNSDSNEQTKKKSVGIMKVEDSTRIVDGLSLTDERNEYLRHEDPSKSSQLATNLIESGRVDADKRSSSIIEAFSQQYRTREQESLVQIATLEREKQISSARCEKLESENAATSSDLAYLEQRTLSLVLMSKTVRATLDQQLGTTDANNGAEPEMYSEAAPYGEPTTAPADGPCASSNGSSSAKP